MIKELPQEYTSEKTSINKAKVPAIFKLAVFYPNTINLDYGGGKFDTATEFLKEQNVHNLIYDPFNRTKEHNEAVIKMIEQAGGADTVTCSNVLNVIKELDVRLNILQNIKQLMKPNGIVYIKVYVGNGTGIEKVTKAGFQLNRKPEQYLEEVQTVFPKAYQKGSLIIAVK